MTMIETEYYVRAGRADDVPGVEMLLSRSFPRLLRADYPPSVMVTAVPLLTRAQPGLVACGTYYVAELTESRRIIGAGGWTLRNPATRRSEGMVGHIRHFATDPDLARRGIGSALMRRCLRDAADAGIERIDCAATRTAVPFYRAFGFEPLGEVEIALAEGITFPAIQMTRAMD